MLTQIEGYFRAGQPTRYLPRTIRENVDAGGDLDELRDPSNPQDQRIASHSSKNILGHLGSAPPRLALLVSALAARENSSKSGGINMPDFTNPTSMSIYEETAL